MGLGLLQLSAIGKENDYFIKSPDITFFKIAYKRYTNYSIEQTPQYFKSTPDFGRKCSIIINKNADLLGTIYLYIELPEINPTSYLFKWSDKIGLALINYIDLEINNIKIDRQYGEWLYIWKELTNASGNLKGYKNMIGDNPSLTEFSYSKQKYSLYIPLCFWFCTDNSLAIPIVSLGLSEVKITVEFNNLNKCYSISPQNYIYTTEDICIYEKGEILSQYISNNNIATSKFVKFDEVEKKLYYDTITSDFINSSSKIVGNSTKVEITPASNPTAIISNFQYLSLANSYFIVNYIYLDSVERNIFYTKDYEALITTIHSTMEKTLNSQNVTYKLPLSNPIKLITWRVLPLYNYLNNDIFNYTSNGDKLITSIKLIINSINTSEISNPSLYSLLQEYQQKYQKCQGIYSYSYSINVKESQPSGSLNYSKIDDAYFSITLSPIVNHQYPVSIKAYAQQYNVLKIKNKKLELLFI